MKSNTKRTSYNNKLRLSKDNNKNKPMKIIIDSNKILPEKKEDIKKTEIIELIHQIIYQN